jgi:hypothetical protein
VAAESKKMVIAKGKQTKEMKKMRGGGNWSNGKNERGEKTAEEDSECK